MSSYGFKLQFLMRKEKLAYIYLFILCFMNGLISEEVYGVKN